MEDTTIENMLKTVESAFAQQDYLGALKILEKHQNEISPGIWHYNVGTIYGKLGNYPLSRYHLIMADENGLSTKEVISNRNLVEEKLDIARYEKPISWSDYLIKAGMASSHGLLTSLSLLLIIVALLSFWKKQQFKIFSVVLAIGIAVMGLNWWIHSWSRSIVLSGQPLHEGPSAIFEAKDEVPVGVLLVTIEKEGWLQIIYPSRFQGWIKNKGLKELE